MHAVFAGVHRGVQLRRCLPDCGLPPRHCAAAAAGVYAATAGQDKRIVVWDVNSVTAVAAATAEEVMSGLVWRPDGNELAMVRRGWGGAGRGRMGQGG
mgnify:CR=1 FL=1